jgi:DNA polymerase elongation subunit (family B)
MYVCITYEQLKQKISKGARIRWCGQARNGCIVVQIFKGDISSFFQVEVDELVSNWKSYGVLRNGGARKPLADVGYVPSKVDSFVTYRNATVLGINISGDCTIESGKIYTTVDGCTCGYDIELDMRNEIRGGFPLPSVPILSVAMWCTCGYRCFISTMNIQRDYCITVESQTELVSAFMDQIIAHQPLWLVGWNCYAFDNTCLSYNAIGTDYTTYFRKVKISTANVVDYGYIMDIPGVYNVDPLIYMQRSPPLMKKYNKDFSLYGVAKKLGVTAKTEMPDLYSNPKPLEILDYNMNDALIPVEIWLKTDLIQEIPSLALTSCCHVYDCCRYMTSVTARCPLSAEAMAIGMKIDWSECEPVLEYKGGRVLEPVRGIHKNVVVCDFSSMYPTIMIDANISPETLDVLEADDHEDGDVWYDNTYIYVRAESSIARFPRVGDNLTRRLLLKYVSLRTTHKRDNPTYAGTLKVVANSIYGSTGYPNSPMYSPLCAIATTAIGRWCLDLACKTFEDYGMRIVYGDTDSCMAKETYITESAYGGDTVAHAKHILVKLKERLGDTPFSSMNMELEEFRERMILLDKKKYCYISEKGTVEYKGMSVVRRDTLGICKEACVNVSNALLESNSIIESNNAIARYISGVVSRCLSRKLTASDVSMVKKRNQRRCYVYTNINGKEESTPIDMSTNVVSDYSTSHVLSSFRQEVLRIVVPCGLGSLSDIMARSDLLF